MSTELTWVTDANRAVASAASAANQSKWEMWYLCASLVGNTGLGFASNTGNWAIVRTCGSTDGTAGNLTADTTDRLHLGGSGAFTLNDWVFGANTTNGTGRSWALLQSPAAIGSIYMLVDFGNATNGKCDITFGVTLSGNGSTTTAPTFSDGWSYAAAQFNNNSIANTHRNSLSLSSRGDFYWFETFDTCATMYSILGCTKLASPHSNDLYPAVSLYVGGNGVNSSGAGYVSSVNAGGFCTVTNAIAKGRNYSGTGTPALVALYFGLSISSSLGNCITVTNYTAANASDTTYSSLPIFLLDVTNTDLKGRVYDLTWVCGAMAQGGNTPNTTPYDNAKFGHCLFPWVSTSSPLI